MTEPREIRVFRTEELNTNLRSAIVDLCVAAHQDENFRDLFSYFPSGSLHFLAFQDQELVSHAIVTTRWLEQEGHSPLKTAYVDAVATLPSAQRRGHGSALMRYLANKVDANYAIGCLGTDEAGFYERLGWQVWRGPLAARGEQGLIATPEQHGIMVLGLSQTPELNLDARLIIVGDGKRTW